MELALAVTLAWVGRRWRLRPGQLFTLYVAGYAAGRIWVEALRSDPAALLFGVRFNLLFSAAALVVALGVFLARLRSPDSVNRVQTTDVRGA